MRIAVRVNSPKRKGRRRRRPSTNLPLRRLRLRSGARQHAEADHVHRLVAGFLLLAGGDALVHPRDRTAQALDRGVDVDALLLQRGDPVGELLAADLQLRDLAVAVAAALPDSAPGLLVGGDLDATVETVAVSGGAGDSLLAAARSAGADAFLTADLRHHPASEHLEAGRPYLLCGTHWATEWVGLPPLARYLEHGAAARGRTLTTYVSVLVTDPWALRLSTGVTDADPAPEPPE